MITKKDLNSAQFRQIIDKENGFNRRTFVLTNHMPWPITGRTAFNPFCDEHGFLLWIRSLLLNKKQKIICVTEEVTAVISHSRPSIFYATDYLHGYQSTSLNVKHMMIKLKFNKMNVSNFEDAFNNFPNQCFLAQANRNSSRTQGKHFRFSSPSTQQPLLVHGSYF